jgi:hypothetical protein
VLVPHSRSPFGDYAIVEDPYGVVLAVESTNVGAEIDDLYVELPGSGEVSVADLVVRAPAGQRT